MQSMKDLIDFLNKHTKLYDEGHPEITDYEWDKVYFMLQNLEQRTGIIYPNSPTQKISYRVVPALEKVEHNHLMLSLEKTKLFSDVQRFFDDKETLVMCKMDGLTCSLRYENHILVSAETRGNGVQGEDILHNAKIIPSIPNYIDYDGELIVDGEIICKYDDFEQFSQEYTHPRNFAAGSIRLLDSRECKKRNLTFVAWDVIQGFSEYNSLYMKLCSLKDLGFTIVPSSLVSKFDFLNKGELLRETMLYYAKLYNYPIDGLVFKFNDIAYGQELGKTGHHFKNALAYKFYDDLYETTLIDIEWQIGKSGILTPVAVFSPIEIDNTIVERASLHNITVAKETLHISSFMSAIGWKGQTVYVSKRNQIIPQIEDSEEDDDRKKQYFDIPSVCPFCGESVEFEETQSAIFLHCSNSACKGKLINRLDYFCSRAGLNIKGLSTSTLEKLIDWGWIGDLESIFELNEFRQEWIKKDGFGAQSVDNILSNIENATNCDLHNFITALSIPLISSSYSKEICKKVNSYDELRDLIDNNFDFTSWDGFGPEKSESIKSFDYSEADYLVQNFLNISNTLYDTNKGEKPLKDKIFVITGSLNYYKNRNELKSIIESLGGKVASSVSKKTTYLVNNDIESNSVKNTTAKQLGVTIITEEECKSIIES